jgi:hypothetical protein
MDLQMNVNAIAYDWSLWSDANFLFISDSSVCTYIAELCVSCGMGKTQGCKNTSGYEKMYLAFVLML